MNIEALAMSEECRKKIISGSLKELPWDKLEPGLSFRIPFGVMKEDSLRAMVGTASRRDVRSYKCFKNETEKMFEITVVNRNSFTFDIVESSPEVKRVKINTN